MPARRYLLGCLAALVSTGVLVAVMLPFRSHVAVAVVTVVLVVPVVLGSAVGGFRAGVVGVVAGFLCYDLVFIPPYGTLDVGRAENWVALAVYVAVMLVVSRVVDLLWRAEGESRESQADTERLFELAELLVGDRPPRELFSIVVRSVRESFGLTSVVLLLPSPAANGVDRAHGLQPVAHAGDDVDVPSVLALRPPPGAVTTLRSVPVGADGAVTGQQAETLVLSVADRTVGLLVIVGRELPRRRRDLLAAFANHIAAAVERSQLREQALRVQVLEEVDRHRRSLLGAVSHDLRTPLATIKASASALLDPALPLSEADRADLASLIESRADNLERVVSNLLDLARIQAGALVLDLESVSIAELFGAVVDVVGPEAARVTVQVEPGLPPIEIDRSLMVAALANVLANALRYGPPGSVVTLAAEATPPGSDDSRRVQLSVTDEGPGISASEREAVFGFFVRGSEQQPGSSGGTGLGLAIARAFVEALGGTIAVDPAYTAGTRLVIRLPGAETDLTGEPARSSEARTGS